jgi:ligand-binding SRPBCC domain-containing protein
MGEAPPPGSEGAGAGGLILNDYEYILKSMESASPWGTGPARAGGRAFRLERAQVVARPRREVFAFFADAFNLESITPAFLRFRITTPRPIEMKPGTVIDYRLRLHGVPFRWRTRIETFEPERSFTDVQLVGPYRRWRHRHDFVDVAGGTEVRDVVDYEMPLGPIGAWARRVFVARSLDRIFDSRRRAVAEILDR